MVSSRVALLLAGYASCSSAMLVVNKAAVMAVPLPSLLLLVQLGTCVLFVLGLKVAGTEMKVIPNWEVASRFTCVSLAFLGTIYTNMRALQFIGVNAFVVLKSTTPLAVAMVDWAVLGRQLPSARSLFSLVGLLFCSTLYVGLKDDVNSSSTAFSLHPDRLIANTLHDNPSGLIWSGLWFMMFLFDMIYVKYVVDSVKTSGWERTLYQNALAMPFLALVPFSHPYEELVVNLKGCYDAMGVVLLSCLCGTGLSYTGLMLRGEVSATAFSVVGVASKMVSVGLNEVFIAREASQARLWAIISCIVFSSMYRQSPYRPGHGPNPSMPK